MDQTLFTISCLQIWLLWKMFLFLQPDFKGVIVKSLRNNKIDGYIEL
jgi:hypothetical protein